jgi:hypothetical protein
LTKPTITYGHVWTHDGDSLTNWHHEDGAPDLAGGAIALDNGDYLLLSCLNTDHDGEFCYWTYYDEAGATDLDINTTINPKFLIRYKTSVATAGLGLAVKAIYSGGAAWILGTDAAPVYSTTYKVEALTLSTVLGTLDHIRVYAINELDHTANNIHIDFLTAYQGIFLWPFHGGVRLDGYNTYARLKPINKVGNATQWLGADDSTLRVWGDIDTTGVDAAGVPIVNSGWHGRWTTHDGEAFYQVLHYMSSEPWVWFTSDVASLKITLDHFGIEQADTAKNLLVYELDMHEYRLGSAGVETNLERFGIT